MQMQVVERERHILESVGKAAPVLKKKKRKTLTNLVAEKAAVLFIVFYRHPFSGFLECL
jgi:hypothetical protein